jgi:hypothetical protein
MYIIFLPASATECFNIADPEDLSFSKRKYLAVQIDELH